VQILIFDTAAGTASLVLLKLGKLFELICDLSFIQSLFIKVNFH